MRVSSLFGGFYPVTQADPLPAGGQPAHGPPAEGDCFGYDPWQCFREPIEAAIAIGYRAAAFAEAAGMLNRAFCSSLSVA